MALRAKVSPSTQPFSSTTIERICARLPAAEMRPARSAEMKRKARSMLAIFGDIAMGP